MREYIFNFESIPIHKDATGYGGKSVWFVEATSVKEAVEKAEEYFKDNEQFKFNYQMVS